MKMTGILRALTVGAATALIAGLSPAVSWAEGEQPLHVSGVVYLDDAAVAGVKVCDLYGDSSTCATTAADGSYSVDVVPLPSQVYGTLQCLAVYPVIDAHTGLFAPVTTNDRSGMCRLAVSGEPGSTVTGYDVHLTSFSLVTGQVVNGAGKPITTAKIDSGLAPRAVNANGRFSVRQGVFTYDGAHLTVSAPGYETAYSPRTTFSGEIGKIVLAKTGQTGVISISGKVSDPKGKPFVGATLCLVGGTCLTRTDQAGGYAALFPRKDYSVTSWNVYAVFADGSKSSKATISINSGVFASFVTRNDIQVAGDGTALVAPRPVISGSVKVGKKLTAKTGKWLPAPVSLSYQWYANGKKISGATGKTFRLTKAQRGKKITVVVTGSKKGFVSERRVSKATKKVAR